MEIIDYFTSDRQEHWLNEIGKSDWGAGKYLHQLLSENKLCELVGASTKVLLLTDGEELASFCTLADRDDVPDTALTPWMGFVYTFPQYRGRRLVGQLLAYGQKCAAEAGARYVYISTNHTGLYEKYGYIFYQMMKDMEGEDSRVYRIAL